MIDRFISYCENHLDFSIQAPIGYQSAPLCALDSVFSIGVKYKSVENVVSNFLIFLGNLPMDTTISTSDVLDRIGNMSVDDLAVVLNRQRTSTRGNSILKAEAFLRYLNIMQEFRIESCEDVRNSIDNQDFHNQIKAIPGQRSGLTLDYLYILARVDNYVKVDRHITRFTCAATGVRNLTKDEIIHCIRTAATYMSENNYYGMNARWLDHIIWTYQSGH